MKHLSYQTLQTMANYSTFWVIELGRSMYILKTANFSYGAGAEYMAAWYYAHKGTIDAQIMHGNDLAKIRREMARRRSLVGWM